MSDYLRAEYYHRALKSFGSPYEFTLNLSPDIEAQARRQAVPLDWLSRRAARRLKAVYGRSLSFWGVLEETLDRRLHLHGEIAVNEDATARDLVRLRKAFRLAGGQWEIGRQHQVKIRPAPDEGWVSYCLKDFWRGLPGVRKLLGAIGSPWRLTFQGSQLGSTRDTNARAARLFKLDRGRSPDPAIKPVPITV